MQRIKTVSDFLNFLSVVIVSAPDRFRKFDFLAEHEQMNLHSAFEELNRGLTLLSGSAPEALVKLNDLLEQSLRAYEAGDHVGGAHLLQDFEEQVFPGS